MTALANGTPVEVLHDLGVESGIVLASTRPAPGDVLRYVVEFGDGTCSHWPAHRVVETAR